MADANWSKVNPEDLSPFSLPGCLPPACVDNVAVKPTSLHPLDKMMSYVAELILISILHDCGRTSMLLMQNIRCFLRFVDVPKPNRARAQRCDER